MNKKIIIMALLIMSLLVFGCMRSSDVICNHDGVCEDDETDDCVDCLDVLGRGIPVPPVENDLIDQN